MNKKNNQLLKKLIMEHFSEKENIAIYPSIQSRLRPVTKPAEKPQVLAAARIMLTRISRSLVNKRQSLNGHRQSRTGFWIEVAW